MIFRILAFVFLIHQAQANIEGKKWVFHAKDRDHSFELLGEVRGTPFVALGAVTQSFGLTTRNISDKEVEIKNSKNKQWVKLNTQSSALNASWGKASSLSRPIIKVPGGWRVPIDFGDRVLKPLLYKEIPPRPQVTRPLLEAQVLIDPGHGGNDYGAHDGNFREKDYTLILARELATELEKRDIPTALTRHQDIFLSLQERTQMAHRSRAALFISIHLNSEPKAKSSGFEVYILSLDEDRTETIQAVAAENQIIPQELPEGVEKTVSDLRAAANFEQSLGFAKRTQNALAKYLRPFGKAVKAGPFYVLYGVSMPALLVEFAFINSKQDQKWLQKPQQRAVILTHLAEELAKTLKSAKPPTKENNAR